MIVFDIETGPLPEEQLVKQIPAFDPLVAVPDMAPFDPTKVATGNLKDLDKINTKIEAARAEHATLAATIDERRETARKAHFDKCVEKAALSATTGQVLAIGWSADEVLPEFWIVDAAIDQVDADGLGQIVDGVVQVFRDEFSLLINVWENFRENVKDHVVGHGIFGFDLPFLIRRSWLLGIDVPSAHITPNGAKSYRPWSNQFVDLMDVWGCGNRNDMISLDSLDNAFGGEGKPEGVNGGDFARLFHGTPEERQQALDYLRNDLAMIRRVAGRMQLL